MNEVIVVSPDKLHEIVKNAVESGVSAAIASIHKQTPKEMNELEAAEYLGLAPTTLRMWRTQKRGPKYHKTGRTVRYARKDLDSYLESSEVQTIDSLEARHGTFC